MIWYLLCFKMSLVFLLRLIMSETLVNRLPVFMLFQFFVVVNSVSYQLSQKPKLLGNGLNNGYQAI